MRGTTRKTLRFYIKHLKKQKLLTFLSLFGIFIGVSGNAAAPIVIKYIVDAMSQGLDAVSFSDVLYLLVPLAIFYGLNSFGWRLGTYSICKLEPRVMSSINNECFEAIHRHSYNFFNNEFVGSLVKRVVRMSRAFESFFDVMAFEMFTTAIRLTAAVAVLFWISPVFGAAMFLWGVLFVSFNYFISNYKLKKYDLHRVAADSALTAVLADTISNNVNIKLFSTRKFEENNFADSVDDWRKKTEKSWIFNAHAELVQDVFMVFMELLVLYLAIQMWGRGDITVGDFVLLETYLLSTFMFIWHFGRSIRRLYESFADAEEMTEILHKEIEVKDKKNAKELVLSRAKIEFKNVRFSYEDEGGIIKSLNLNIKPGERVALIGPSGGGKTTIVKLLLRLFDVDGGAILLDGQNIADVKQDSLRAEIAMVPQDPILFHRSLLENIRYGRLDASDEEVIAASKMAHCHEFIESFPKNYETTVGERGVKLSGGERQRIAIARAILSNAKILVLDEATSNLDVHSEQLIQDALAHLTKNKTTIVIAHRLSTVKNVDRIIVIEGGNIVEEGSHHELIRNEGGLYKSLWNLYMSDPNVA